MDFVRLPPELQETVVSLMTRADLLRLQRASKRCHEFASLHIWRKLQFFIEGRHASPATNAREFKLMQALQTLVCSEHNYAQYIRLVDIRSWPVDNSNLKQLFKIRYFAGSCAADALNISILTILARATNLESFRLDAPLDLSDAVWQSLGKKAKLNSMRVFLNGRESLASDRRTQLVLPPELFRLTKGSVSYRYIDRCSNLKHLALHGISELDYLEKVATCVRSSTSTLITLELCFSEQLFAKGKKLSGNVDVDIQGIPFPPADFLEDEESILSEDEDGQPAPDPAIAQANDDAIRHNRAAQEAALARIFSIDPEKSDKIVEKALKSSAIVKTKGRTPAFDELMADQLPELVTKLLKESKMSDDELDTMKKLRSQIDEAIRSRKQTKHGKSNVSSASTTNKLPNSQPHLGPPLIINDPVFSNSPPPPHSIVWPGLKAPAHHSQPFGVPKTYSPSMSAPYTIPTNALPKHNPPQGPDDVLENFNFDGYIDDNPANFNFSDSPSKIPASALVPAQQAAQSIQSILTKLPNPAPVYYTHHPSSGKKLSQLGKVHPKPPLPLPVDMSNSSSSSATELGGKSSSSSSVAQDSIAKDEPYEDMDIDIEHPDEINGESGDDQESIDGEPPPVPLVDLKGKGKARERLAASSASSARENLPENVADQDRSRDDEMKTIPNHFLGGPRQRKSAVRYRRSSSNGSHQGSLLAVLKLQHRRNMEQSSTVAIDENYANKVQNRLSPDQVMKEWIRKEHGIALKKFWLYLIPLKASVLGRALQLHRLENLKLLSVGGQGPFWQMMSRAQEDNPLALSCVHTDDVSKSFLDCISKCSHITALFLRHRGKRDKMNTTSKEPANIDQICKLAVYPHVKRITVLSIQNDNGGSWCMTTELLSLLCSRASSLQEFAFQSGLARYSEFLRSIRDPACLPSMKTFRLINSGLVSGHNAGIAITVPPPPPPPIPISANASAVTGSNEMHDAQQLMLDNYKIAYGLAKDAIAQRKEAKDKNLRHFGVFHYLSRVSDLKKIAMDKFPAWLREEYETDNPGLLKFEDWIKTRPGGGGGGWKGQVSIKSTSIQSLTPLYSIYTPSIVHARLS